MTTKREAEKKTEGVGGGGGGGGAAWPNLTSARSSRLAVPFDSLPPSPASVETRVPEVTDEAVGIFRPGPKSVCSHAADPACMQATKCVTLFLSLLLLHIQLKLFVDPRNIFAVTVMCEVPALCHSENILFGSTET